MLGFRIELQPKLEKDIFLGVALFGLKLYDVYFRGKKLFTWRKTISTDEYGGYENFNKAQKDLDFKILSNRYVEANKKDDKQWEDETRERLGKMYDEESKHRKDWNS